MGNLRFACEILPSSIADRTITMVSAYLGFNLLLHWLFRDKHREIDQLSKTVELKNSSAPE